MSAQSEKDDAAGSMLGVEADGDNLVIRPVGSWVIGSIARADREIARIENEVRKSQILEIDLAGLDSLDTSGAWLLRRLQRAWLEGEGKVRFSNHSAYSKSLLDAVDIPQGEQVAVEEKTNPLLRTFGTLGKVMYTMMDDTRMGLNIIGAAIRGPQMKMGRRGGVRPISIIHHIDRMGIRAVPIVMLMSFLIGGIIAQQGAFQLRLFGLEIWTVDLVGVLLLREVGVLLTAIMIAGRSGSAMTAEIGSMKMREEIDALTVIGLNPIGVLVFPRLVALTVSLPLLTFLANMAALGGAALVLRFYSGISLEDFIHRLRDGIDLSTVFSGLIKAPFMAMIIGTMAAVEGLKVEGSAESLGRRTTSAVVKAIFFVIVVDGLFAVFYAAIDY
jgi:phospholipid/cholesterol/gamma-HCH transport system permease protein